MSTERGKQAEALRCDRHDWGPQGSVFGCELARSPGEHAVAFAWVWFCFFFGWTPDYAGHFIFHLHAHPCILLK